jgi:hypothetical protein
MYIEDQVAFLMSRNKSDPNVLPLAVRWSDRLSAHTQSKGNRRLNIKEPWEDEQDKNQG